ncbi:MAG: KH domain-containing protein [Candidatus Altiarchaeota archaeon]
MQYVRIPQERIAVLIGSKGEIKKEIELRTQTKLSIEETEVSVEGESVDEWISKDIIKAIGRGFNPEKAFRLLGDENILEVIDLRDYGGVSEKNMARLKGRVIGEKGRSWKVIEDLTGAFLAVYGKTISIIGSYGEVDIAKRAVDMLLSGSNHSNVYRFLERSQGRR